MVAVPVTVAFVNVPVMTFAVCNEAVPLEFKLPVVIVEPWTVPATTVAKAEVPVALTLVVFRFEA